MDLLKTVVSLVFVLLSIGTINNFVVFGSAITCEAAKNGSCVLSRQECLYDHHDGESATECFGEEPHQPPPTCPTVEGIPVLKCPNYTDHPPAESTVRTVSAVPYLVSISKYRLHVSWTSDGAASDTHLQGYQVRLYNENEDDLYPVEGCACKNRSETEHNFTLSYDKDKQLRVAVTSYPIGSARARETNFIVPKSCYDSRFPYDPIHCGAPRYSEPTNIKMDSTLTSNDTMSTVISWEPPVFDSDISYPRPTTYYLNLSHSEGAKQENYVFVASNTEAVTIHSLNFTNMTMDYIQIKAYVNCSGYSSARYDSHGCGYYSIAKPIPHPVSATSSSLMISNVRSTPVPTSSAFQWDKNNILAVTGGAVGFIMLVVIIGIVLIRKMVKARQDNYSPIVVSPDPDVDNTGNDEDSTVMPNPKPQPFPPQRPIVVESPVCPSIFLLYSPHSPEVEERVILQRICHPLRKRHVNVTVPGEYTHTGGNSPAQWLSNRMMKASIVLCVCNPTFKEEWDGTSKWQPSVEVSTLKELVSGALNREGSLSSRFATVYLQQSARNCIPDLLSGTKSFLMTEIDSIVSFTTEKPNYAPVS